MKRIIIVMLILVFALGGVFAQQRFRNGVYTSKQTAVQPATGDPIGGNVTVAVTFRSNRITRIEITEYEDTEDFVNVVTRFFIPTIIEEQSPDVDAFSGATGTSNAVKNAVRDAIDQARR